MLGDKIKLLRTNNKMYQQDLANALSVSKSTIAMWETNKRIPDAPMLVKIANFFDITVDHLLSDKTEQKEIAPIKHDRSDVINRIGADHHQDRPYHVPHIATLLNALSYTSSVLSSTENSSCSSSSTILTLSPGRS